MDHRDGSTTVLSRRRGQPVRVTYQTTINGRRAAISTVPGADMTSPGTGRTLTRALPPTGRRSSYPLPPTRRTNTYPLPPTGRTLWARSAPSTSSARGSLAPKLYAALLGDSLLEACRLASWADGSLKRQRILERALFTQLPSPSVLAKAGRALRETGWQGLPGRDTLLRILEGARPPSR